jgi:hypothetical protein
MTRPFTVSFYCKDATAVTRSEKIVIIRDFVSRLRILIDGLPDKALITPYHEGEWTIAQNIHHLADTHITTYLRFKSILTEDKPTLPVILAPQMAELPDASDACVELSLMILEAMHARWVNMMLNIKDWSRKGYYPRLDSELSLDFLLDYYSEHCNMHYHQIEGVMAKMP